MSVLKVFSVYDCKAEGYLPPIFFPTDAAAVRAFASAVQSPEHDFARFPEDYTLFCVGEWNDEAGELTAYGTQISVVTARSLTKVVELKHNG